MNTNDILFELCGISREGMNEYQRYRFVKKQKVTPTSTCISAFKWLKKHRQTNKGKSYEKITTKKQRTNSRTGTASGGN